VKADEPGRTGNENPHHAILLASATREAFREVLALLALAPFRRKLKPTLRTPARNAPGCEHCLASPKLIKIRMQQSISG
jgi:hypothetical protein